MTTVQSYTSAKMDQIADDTVVSGQIVGDDLVLTTRGGTQIPSGDVRGPKGDTGLQGDIPEAPIDTRRFLRGDGQWLPFEAWVLTLDNNTNPFDYPPGFTVESGMEYGTWSLEISGLGPMMAIDFLCYEYGGAINTNAKFILPQSLRPFYNVNVPGVALDARSGYKATGVLQGILGTNGELTAPRGEPIVMSVYRENSQTVSKVVQYDTSELVQLRLNFTMLRNAWDIPVGAVAQ